MKMRVHLHVVKEVDYPGMSQHDKLEHFNNELEVLDDMKSKDQFDAVEEFLKDNLATGWNVRILGELVN